MKKILMLIAVKLSLFASLFSYASVDAEHAEQKIVTIWIHGSMPPVPKAIEESHFHLNLGLTQIKEYAEKHPLLTKTTFSLVNIAKTLNEAMPTNFDLEHYYTFGWSGKLSFDEREEYAHKLYMDILQLKQEYLTTYGQAPYIRLIGHSHGGNVILNLALMAETEDDHNFYIDEIILLACPVQAKTESYIQAQCFKKAYAFYSHTDMIQVLDPQGLYKKGSTKKIFSNRTFDHCQTLHQAGIKINGISLAHIDFICINFLQYLPAICKEVDHFYDTVIPNQIDYEKTIDIHVNKQGSIHFCKELKAA